MLDEEPTSDTSSYCANIPRCANVPGCAYVPGCIPGCSNVPDCANIQPGKQPGIFAQPGTFTQPGIIAQQITHNWAASRFFVPKCLARGVYFSVWSPPQGGGGQKYGQITCWGKKWLNHLWNQFEKHFSISKRPRQDRQWRGNIPHSF